MNKLAMGSKMGKARVKEKKAKMLQKMKTMLKMPRIAKSVTSLMRDLMKHLLSNWKNPLSLNLAE